MSKVSREICFRLKAARKAAKVGQSELAAEIGCRQSAISMFEQGQPAKLSDEFVERIARKFGVSLKEEVAAALPSSERAAPRTGFCPNTSCPTNRPLEMDARRFLLPDLALADPVGGRYCAYCGEVLERTCPNCGAPVHTGAVCSLCGEPYLAS